MNKERETFSTPAQIHEHMRKARKVSSPDSLPAELGNSSQEERMVNADIESGVEQGGKGVSEALPRGACPPSYLTEQHLKNE